MKSHVLRLAIATITFSIGVVAAAAFSSRPAPPVVSRPSPKTSATPGSASCRETLPPPQQPHAISRQLIGYVRDREGRPVVGAEVRANGQRGSAGRLPTTVSKADGSFTINIWWPDTYSISAEHIRAGYPDVTNGFYGSFFGEAPAIAASESNHLEPVEVRVGPEAGRIILRIVDEQSGRPVKGGLLRVCRIDNPRMCMSTSTAFPRGRYELLVPEVPFTIKFEVWGNGWEEREAVGDDGAPLDLLQVDLGGRREVKVRLRRVRGGGLEQP